MVIKNLMTILILVLGLSFISGCTTEVEEKAPVDDMQLSVDTGNNQEISEEKYTKKLVSNHDSSDDCWVIVEDGVYDLSSLITNHQGKETLEACGRTMDMLLLQKNLDFDNLEEARARLQDYYLGELN
ncbi:MAG: cytochrome b5 domain-containing protein [Nanobdellota archaeon]